MIGRDALLGRRCLGRWREENPLLLPIIVSAMLRPFSNILSIIERGKDFLFFRTRGKRVKPRCHRSPARFLPRYPLSPNSLPRRSWVRAGPGAVSETGPGVSL